LIFKKIQTSVRERFGEEWTTERIVKVLELPPGQYTADGLFYSVKYSHIWYLRDVLTESTYEEFLENHEELLK